jgi:formylglycine-generating enzyme required for sulfatase activity
MDDVRLLGDYRLIKQIGHGSLGQVFVGEHRFTKKQCAIKILPEELALDRGFLSRFEDEVAVISTLDHPHIVKIFNVSFSQGLYFLVTDCIVDQMGESTNLWQYFSARDKSLSEEELIAITSQIADALDYAHGLKSSNSRKLIHRGIKLNNILIGSDQTKAGSSSVRVMLSDFGLSKVVGLGACLTRTFKAMAEALGVGSALPQQKIGQDRYPFPSVEMQKLIPLHQSFLQNFAFLAPEQKRIDAVLDEKVDVYAFGVLVYFLLMNEFPEGCFSLPSSKKNDYSWNWDLVITECLKPNPEERPKSLEELLLRASNCTRTVLPTIIQKEVFEMHEMTSAAPTVQEFIQELGVTHEYGSVKEEIISKRQEDALVGATKKESQQFDLFGVPTTSSGKEGGILGNIERVVKEYHPEKREAKNVQPILTEMEVIPGNAYFRGSNHGCRDEMPRHSVHVQSFALDVHPVTNEQFVRFLDAIGEEKDPQNHDIIKLRDSRIKKSSGRFIIEPGYAKHPIVGVTWYGAVAYANWIGKRLPTEAEWEIACCGGFENPMYPTGESIEKTQANFFSSDTTAVMSYPPNKYGLYDMAGNVYEWCYDWYEYAYYEASAQEPDFPKGPLQGVYRVLRGGCWKSLKEDLRCSKRHRNNPGAANGTYGFRLAADANQG